MVVCVCTGWRFCLWRDICDVACARAATRDGDILCRSFVPLPPVGPKCLLHMHPQSACRHKSIVDAHWRPQCTEAPVESLSLAPGDLRFTMTSHSAPCESLLTRLCLFPEHGSLLWRQASRIGLFGPEMGPIVRPHRAPAAGRRRTERSTLQEAEESRRD